MTASTMPGRLVELATSAPKRVAFRRKVLGIWEETSFAEYTRRAARIGIGLSQLGVGEGDRVAIASENRPEWLFVDLGVQGIGAATVGVSPAAHERDVRHVLQTSDAVAVVVEDELQLDKVLSVRDDLPALRHVVAMYPQDESEWSGADAHALARLEEGTPVDVLDAWEERVAALDEHTCATVHHTAGATGPPRAVRMSHVAMVAAGRALLDAIELGADDDVLSPLPLSHIANRVLSGAGALLAGATVHFGEAGLTFADELREVQPSVFLAPPRVWEQLYASTEFRIRHASRVKRAAYRYGVWRDGPLAWLVLERSLRAKLGMSRARSALSTGAAVSPDVLAWLRRIGVPVHDLYGPAEAGGVVSLGVAVPGVELQVSPSGELLVRSALLADDVAGEDGWLSTGDLARIHPDGRVTITGRVADVIELSNGARIDPAPIEAQLKASPFIRDAVLVGHRRPHAAASIGVARWRRGLPPPARRPSPTSSKGG
jgi:long-chain acyl-CoA synthetase